MSESPIMAIGDWKNNAELIANGVVPLGYLRSEWTILDATYGLGRFWRYWCPPHLVTNDLNPVANPDHQYDFRAFPPHWASTFSAVVLDPPYKLNGTGGSHPSDVAYGVATTGVRWQDRMAMCKDGIVECARLLKPFGILLVKCQDQVCSGKVRWQTIEFSDTADRAGCVLIDMLHLPSYRAQPEGRTQQHARRNYSTLLIMQKLLSK